MWGVRSWKTQWSTSWVQGWTRTTLRSTHRVQVETLSSRWARPGRLRRLTGLAHLLLKVSTFTLFVDLIAVLVPPFTHPSTTSSSSTSPPTPDCRPPPATVVSRLPTSACYSCVQSRGTIPHLETSTGCATLLITIPSSLTTAASIASSSVTWRRGPLQEERREWQGGEAERKESRAGGEEERRGLTSSVVMSAAKYSVSVSLPPSWRMTSVTAANTASMSLCPAFVALNFASTLEEERRGGEERGVRRGVGGRGPLLGVGGEGYEERERRGGGGEQEEHLVEGHVSAAGPVGGECVEGLGGPGGGVLLALHGGGALHGVMPQQGRRRQLALPLWVAGVRIP